MRVLIADDDRDTAMTLGIVLRSEGHDVLSTDRLSEVAGLVREFQPRVVFLDVEMRDAMCFEVAQQLLREHGAGCPTLVATSVTGDDADLAQAAMCGFHSCLAKPYRPEKVLSFVERLETLSAIRRPAHAAKG